MLRAAFAIARRDLRQRIRDRSAILIGLIAPLGLATVFSLIGGEIDLEAKFAVANNDDGPLGQAFLEGPMAALTAAGRATVTPARSSDDALAFIREGDGHAAFIIPAGFSAAVFSGQPARLTVAVADSDEFETAMAEPIARSFVAALESTEVAVGAAAALGADPQDPALRARALAEPLPIAVEADAIRLRVVPLKTFYAAGMAIFFLFLSVQFAFLSLHAERRDGTLARMLAAPIRPSTIVLGKAAVGFGIGLATTVILVTATTLLLGADWGPHLAVGILLLAGVFAAMGIMGAVSTLARTYDQASSMGMVVAIVLALLGGSFFPVFLAPGFIAELSLVTPHAWWFRGFGDIQADGATVVDALPAAAILALFGAVFGSIALLRASRMLRQ
jgi:ABC-2 type transport system permease protein